MNKASVEVICPHCQACNRTSIQTVAPIEVHSLGRVPVEAIKSLKERTVVCATCFTDLKLTVDPTIVVMKASRR